MTVILRASTSNCFNSSRILAVDFLKASAALNSETGIARTCSTTKDQYDS